MSPRAACRLERIGFERVYDYVGGIADWKGAGLPLEGKGAWVQTVTDASYSRGASWSTSGKIVFAPSGNSGIYVVDDTGRTARRLTDITSGDSTG